MISLTTTSDLVILNMEDYEQIAQMDGGRAYLAGQEKILCSYNGMLHQFPYAALEMLKEGAKKTVRRGNVDRRRKDTVSCGLRACRLKRQDKAAYVSKRAGIFTYRCLGGTVGG